MATEPNARAAGVEMPSSASTPIPSGKAGIYNKANAPTFTKSTGSDVPLLYGGGGGVATGDLPNPGGDVGGSYASMTVQKFQGRVMAATAPNAKEVIGWDGSTWKPMPTNDVIEGGGTPTVAIGTDLGTAPNGAAVAVSGNDRAHTLTITAGTDATAGGNAIITVTFGVEWGGTPRVLIGPADDNAFYVIPSMGQGDPYLAFRQADVTTTGYIIRAGTGPNLVGFSFKLNVMVGR